jgi:hypothetical protein
VNAQERDAISHLAQWLTAEGEKVRRLQRAHEIVEGVFDFGRLTQAEKRLWAMQVWGQGRDRAFFWTDGSFSWADM